MEDSKCHREPWWANSAPGQQPNQQRRREKKRCSSVVCRAGETENKLSREWKLEKKNENMIKSVSQRLLAFSRYTERGVGNREPTGDFCRPSETSSSHTLAYRVELCRDLKRMHQEKHTGTQKQTRQIDTNIVLCCVPPCMALCLRGSDIPNTKLHEITAHDTGLPHQL